MNCSDCNELYKERGTSPPCHSCSIGKEKTTTFEEIFNEQGGIKLNTSQKDSQGLTICPVYKRHYKPDLPPTDPNDERRIQDIYPQAKPYQREQLITGICSDKCWNKLFPEEET